VKRKKRRRKEKRIFSEIKEEKKITLLVKYGILVSKEEGGSGRHLPGEKEKGGPRRFPKVGLSREKKKKRMRLLMLTGT